MSKLEYISGDLVMTNGVFGGTAKDVVYKVMYSDPSKISVLDDGTVLKGTIRLKNLEDAKLEDKGYLYYGSCYVYFKDIIPIPLTLEILKKSGWKKEVMSRGVSDRHLVYTKPDIEEYGYFPIYIEKGIGNELMCIHLLTTMYVNQLHTLGTSMNFSTFSSA